MKQLVQYLLAWDTVAVKKCTLGALVELMTPWDSHTVSKRWHERMIRSLSWRCDGIREVREGFREEGALELRSEG